MKLNELYGDILSFTDFIPIKLDFSQALTCAKHDSPAYALNASGIVKHIVFSESNDNDVFVVRAFLSAKTRDLISQNKQYGNMILSLYMNEMLSVVAPKVDLFNAKIKTFRYPGTEINYFRELEDNAGLELRLYVEKGQ